MPARVAVAVVAALVLAWLAVLERDVRLQARATAALAGRAEAGALARAESDLRAAKLLNPDRRPDIDRALALRARQRTDAALALVAGVVRDEPDNLLAWGVLSVLGREVDPGAVRRAAAARARLDPLNARQGR